MTARARHLDRHAARVAHVPSEYVLVTGGAGFIGTNLVHRLLGTGHDVLIFDNFSRHGVQQNVDWLRANHGARLHVVAGDVRDQVAVRRAVDGASQVFHFAAQVAVTTSLVEPSLDFEVNARGTLNVLNAIRAQRTPPSIVFTSTNKVYGALDDIQLREAALRYEPLSRELRRRGIGEGRPLDFHSPYGCSKGAADQYVLDFARSFHIPGVVFRMSCIYGPHQFGTEDQGWVAHFMINALAGQPIVLYGDGKQVRDILFIDDLVDALLLAQQNAQRLSGSAFNLGGGPARTVSLLELLARLEEITSAPVAHSFAQRRVGDQSYYVSDTTRFCRETGWQPKVDVKPGLQRLHESLMRQPIRAARRWTRAILPRPLSVVREA